MADVPQKSTRIILWCVPRTISSALAKCLSAIDGIEIWFEPFCFCDIVRYGYRRVYPGDLPMEYEGNEEVIRKAAAIIHQNVTGCEIVPERIVYSNVKRSLENATGKYVFVKDMAFGMPDEKAREYMPRGYKHVFLIREPVRTLNSYRRAIYKQMLNVGVLTGDAADERKFDLEKDVIVSSVKDFYSGIHDLWKFVKANIDPNCLVFDADDLLSEPARKLPQFCEVTGLPYNDSLLKWDASTDCLASWKAAGDSLLIDAVPFYHTAMTSSCFMPPKTPTPRDQLTDDVKRLSDAAMPYYNEMHKHKV